MGHQIYHESFPLSCDKHKVQEHFDEVARHEDYYEGCSGLPASIRWLDNVLLDNREEAEKWIEENERGYYDQIAVKYREYPRLILSVKYNKLKSRLDELNATYRALDQTFHYASCKSEYIGCKKCGSRISKHYLHNNYCPICHNDLRPASTMERLSNMKERINKLNDEIHSEYLSLQKKQIKHSEIKWIVKVEFHV